MKRLEHQQMLGLRVMGKKGLDAYVLNSLFGLEENKMLAKSNEKEGRFLLQEIFVTGNFGHSDRRYNYKRFRVLRRLIGRGTHLLIHYPSEILWTPIWLVFHKWWKWNKKRHITMLASV